MRCVVTLLDLTHAHVKQDSQEMDSHALVSRLSTILFVWYVCFFEWTATTAIQESFKLFSPFTVKVLVRLEFQLNLVLTVSSKQKENRSHAASYMISATMVIVQPCDYFFRPKSQLVRYLNRKTIGNNEKQWCVIIVSATNEETPYEQLLHYCFFFFITLKIIHSVFLVLF